MKKNNSTSAYREDLRLRILHSAMAAFRSQGVKAVRMDDVACRLSISKRTLYELYGNKEDLLLECLKHHQEVFEQSVRQTVSDSDSVLDVLLAYLRLQAEEFGKTTPAFYYELDKYPKVKAYLEEKRLTHKEKSEVMMRQGVEQGVFRSDVNYQLVNIMVDSFFSRVMEHEVYFDFPLGTIINTLLSVLLRGICTEEGLQRLGEISDFGGA